MIDSVETLIRKTERTALGNIRAESHQMESI